MLFWTLVLGTAALFWWRVVAGYPKRPQWLYLKPSDAAFLESVAEVMYPAGGAIPVAGTDADLPGYVDRYFEALPRGLRTQMRLLFRLVEHATLLWPAPGPGGRRRFTELSVDQRAAVLAEWNDSPRYLRQLVFAALRAILTMGYLGHPAVLRHLGLAPLDIEPPVLEADLLYPRIGEHPSTIPWTRGELTPPSDGTPVDLEGALHPSYAEPLP
ncbi:MAG: gluconate 2-dehydrogenase subunit 3 family protein [Proteobacteria bacterium]|nr:gluconate 2-dehydrogenase subunit 3 family protein [Pseudomonadota bacterium]